LIKLFFARFIRVLLTGLPSIIVIITSIAVIGPHIVLSHVIDVRSSVIVVIKLVLVLVFTFTNKLLSELLSRLLFFSWNTSRICRFLLDILYFDVYNLFNTLFRIDGPTAGLIGYTGYGDC